MAANPFISVTEAREKLRSMYRSDGEINLETVLHRVGSDPIKPVSETGRMRPSTTLVVGGIVLLLLIASFAYFSFGGRA